MTTFAGQPGRGFLHVLRDGEMEVTYRRTGGQLAQTVIDKPSLLFYPRQLDHAFHNAPTEGSDFACATLDFDGGDNHPLVRTLPSVIVLPLEEVDSLGPALDLLFAEIDNVSCGIRVLADRPFEVVVIQRLRWMVEHAAELALQAGL